MFSLRFLFLFLSLLFALESAKAQRAAVPHASSLSVGEYAFFLNSATSGAASSDLHHLYDEKMATLEAPIFRQGEPGNYFYKINSGDAAKPLCYVNLNSERRYVNWKSNNRLASSMDTASTEDGVYCFENDQCITTRVGAAEMFCVTSLSSSQASSATIASIDEELKSNQLVFENESEQATSGSKKIPTDENLLIYLGAFLACVGLTVYLDYECRENMNRSNLPENRRSLSDAISASPVPNFQQRSSEEWRHELANNSEIIKTNFIKPEKADGLKLSIFRKQAAEETMRRSFESDFEKLNQSQNTTEMILGYNKLIEDAKKGKVLAEQKEQSPWSPVSKGSAGSSTNSEDQNNVSYWEDKIRELTRRKNQICLMARIDELLEQVNQKKEPADQRELLHEFETLSSSVKTANDEIILLFGDETQKTTSENLEDSFDVSEEEPWKKNWDEKIKLFYQKLNWLQFLKTPEKDINRRQTL